MNSRDPITLLEVRIQKEETNAGVRQDKYPPWRIDVFSDQPQSAATPPISATSAPPPANPPADNRPKHHGSETRQTDMIWGRAPRAIKAKILAMKEAQGLSESVVVVNLVQKALQIDGDVQYGAMGNVLIVETAMFTPTVQRHIDSQTTRSRCRASASISKSRSSSSPGV